MLLDSNDWFDLLASAAEVPPHRLAEISEALMPDQPINIQYTSGTTGFPKGATLSHFNILNNGYFVGEECGYTEEDRVCIPVPFYHCFGMVLGNLACTTHGATIVVPGPGIIRGGENIYPREIEEYLYSHPDIVDAQVIGVPDLKYGEQVMAWVQLKPGRDLTEEAVREFCEGRIAHFKVPTYVAFVDDFPMTVTGKIQKYRLREMAIADLGLENGCGGGHGLDGELEGVKSFVGWA